MNILRRLTLVDLGLFAALILTAILWINSRSEPRPDPAALTAQLESTAAELVDATEDRDLDRVRAALETAATAVGQLGDQATAAGLRQLSLALTAIEIGAVERALEAVNPFPDTELFAYLYLALRTPLFYPQMPSVTSIPGAEAAHLNYLVPRNYTRQFWGTTSWSIPAGIPESLGEADVAFPGFGLSGKLMFARSPTEIRITFVFNGPHETDTIAEADGFWITRAANQTRLAGNELELGAGFVAMALPADTLEVNAGMLRTADEIVLLVRFEDGATYILRFEVGETGRALFAETL